MTNHNITKEFNFTGSQTLDIIHSGSHVSVKGGDLTVTAFVGDDVTLHVEGNITLQAKAGSNLFASAQGNFYGEDIGNDAKIVAAKKASVYRLGFNGTLEGHGVEVRAEEEKCGMFNTVIDPKKQIVTLRKKPASAPETPDSCFYPEFISPIYTA